MARIPYPEREHMPADVADLLNSIPRNNITEMISHASTLIAPFLRLAQEQFSSLELSTRRRELVILAVAGLAECDYEYVQHVPISEAAGITSDLRERVRDGDFDAPDDPADRALLAFVAAVVRAPLVGDEEFQAVRSQFTERQIVEVLQLIGFYWGLGRVCTTLELELDHPDGLESINAVATMPG